MEWYQSIQKGTPMKDCLDNFLENVRKDALLEITFDPKAFDMLNFLILHSELQ